MCAEMDENLWAWFKSLVKIMREHNDTLIREQGGNNQVMLSIALEDLNSEDWIEINPHSIDLRTGKTHILYPLVTSYREIDVKELLYTRRLKVTQSSVEESDNGEKSKDTHTV